MGYGLSSGHRSVSRSEMETGRVNRPVRSRFFDWLAKPVEKPVKFIFL